MLLLLFPGFREASIAAHRTRAQRSVWHRGGFIIVALDPDRVIDYDTPAANIAHPHIWFHAQPPYTRIHRACHTGKSIIYSAVCDFNAIVP